MAAPELDGRTGPVANLGQVIEFGRFGERTAFVDLRRGVRRFTYAGLDRLIEGLSAGLGSLGIEPGGRVAIIAENGAEFVASYFAIMRAGLVAVPINYRLPQDTVSFILKDADVKLVIADAERLRLSTPEIPIRVIDSDGADGLAALVQEGVAHSVRPAADDLAEILYTSGSTGRPKGVPLTHAGQSWAIRPHVQEGAAERTVIVAPTYHMNGLFFTTVALASGYKIVSLPRFDARRYLNAVARFRATILSGIPTMFALVEREQELIRQLDLSSVHTLSIGSSPLTQPLIDRLRRIFPNASIFNSYGTTEAGPTVFGPHPLGLPRPSMSLGTPRPGVAWRLAGGAGDMEGELELRTPALTTGYLNLPHISSEKLAGGWYRTGDIMRRDADNFFYFVGRADDMFICGGENVYPGEVETLLESHEAVSQAAVVAIPDEVKGEIPIAFVVLEPGHSISASELQRFMIEKGPAFSHPRAIAFLEQIPVAGTHKVDRKALAEMALEIDQVKARSSSARSG